MRIGETSVTFSSLPDARTLVSVLPTSMTRAKEVSGGKLPSLPRPVEDQVGALHASLATALCKGVTHVWRAGTMSVVGQKLTGFRRPMVLLLQPPSDILSERQASGKRCLDPCHQHTSCPVPVAHDMSGNL